VQFPKDVIFALTLITPKTVLFSLSMGLTQAAGTTETQQFENRLNAQLIGQIKTMSEFTASSYGDCRLFLDIALVNSSWLTIF